MKNYRHIRKNPYIYGFSITGFFVFLIISVLLLISFTLGITLTKFIIILFLIGLTYGICKYVVSDEKLLSKAFDLKLPKKYSQYE